MAASCITYDTSYITCNTKLLCGCKRSPKQLSAPQDAEHIRACVPRCGILGHREVCKLRDFLMSHHASVSLVTTLVMVYTFYIQYCEFSKYRIENVTIYTKQSQLECGPMPNVMATLQNIGGALCSTPQSLAGAQYSSVVQ